MQGRFQRGLCDDNVCSQPTCCGLLLGRKGLKFCLTSILSLTMNRSTQFPSCPYVCGRALRSERSRPETVDNWEIPGSGPEQLLASECDGMSLQQGQREGWDYGLIFQHMFPLSSLLSTPTRGEPVVAAGKARPVEVVSSKHHWAFLRNHRQTVHSFKETVSCLSNGSCLTSLCLVTVFMPCSEDRWSNKYDQDPEGQEPYSALLHLENIPVLFSL